MFEDQGEESKGTIMGFYILFFYFYFLLKYSYNIALISAIQQNDSVIYIHICIHTHNYF